MRNILAVFKKEFLQISRDRRTLTLIIMMPIVQLILYGYGINTDTKNMATILYDEDQTSLSRELTQAFEQSSYFNITHTASSFKDLRHTLDLGDVKSGLHIPPNFTKDILSGRHAQLQLLIDGTDSNPANIALNTSQAIVVSFMERQGLMKEADSPIDFRPRMWYNPDLKSSFFLVPGLVGLLIQLLIPIITATAVVKEKEKGNYEQLIVTPIKSHEFIIGKLIPYIVIGLMIAAEIIGIAHYLFQIPIRGSTILLFSLTFLFLVVCLGMGLLASTLAQNQQQASQIVMFFAPPSILLSGFIFPREGMPWIIYQIGELIPLTHFLKIVRGIVLKGLNFYDLWPQTLILFSMAAFILVVSIQKFKKRIE